MIVGMAFEQEKDTILANKDYQDLEKKLLTMGGRELVYMPSPKRLIHFMIDYGCLYVNMPVRQVKGKPSHCHDNVEALWTKHPQKYAMVHGYALSDDGLWREHSWLLEGDMIVETTVARVAYYGVALNPPKCRQCGKNDLPLNRQSGLCVRCVIDNETASQADGVDEN